jgi:hypothetical protein
MIGTFTPIDGQRINHIALVTACGLSQLLAGKCISVSTPILRVALIRFIVRGKRGNRPK